MSKFDQRKTMPRYFFITILMALIAVSVVAKTFYIMTAKRDFWKEVAARTTKDSVSVKPVRGNILSCDGQLMASSLPEYRMYMDFKALSDAGNDSIWEAKVDTICLMLSEIFPEKSASLFKQDLERGRREQKRNFPIWGKRVDYNTYSKVKQMPVFSLSPYKGGFHVEEFNARKKQFGGLASRTLGDMYGAKDSARFGLELAYDTVLRGKNGLINRRKVLNKFLDIMIAPPEDGADIVTTIDVGIQDLAERAVIDELQILNGGNVGVAIVMEVATGDIKAIVNIEKVGENQYVEVKNHAISDLLEPGSVFKTASLLVALDDQVVDTTYRVETGSGVWNMYGRAMKDWNWSKGGYHMLTLPQTLHYSSNIGVSRIIDDHYRNHPEKFVQGIYRTGLADDLGLPLPGASPAKIRMPKKDSKGKQWVNWSSTALPWMSIGYETQVPPISTLTFYNAIANNGKMMRPRFVKQVVKDGKVIKEYPPEVMRESIVKHPESIKKIQTILEQVVSLGLGKKAGSKSFKVAGKTGTAQIWTKGGKTSSFLVSFAGYFPADAPRYSCIVCIQKTGLPASGGGMSGVVFHNIAEGIMSQDIKLDASAAHDSTSQTIPSIKRGNEKASNNVLKNLKIKTQVAQATNHTASNKVPDVKGMGARDAVYCLERQGLRTRIVGRGKVVKQSIETGQTIKKGQVCVLTLQ